MAKILSILLFIFGLLIIIGLSIWVGFPSPQGFDREVICIVGYILGIVLVFFSGAYIIDKVIEKDS